MNAAYHVASSRTEAKGCTAPRLALSTLTHPLNLSFGASPTYAAHQSS